MLNVSFFFLFFFGEMIWLVSLIYVYNSFPMLTQVVINYNKWDGLTEEMTLIYGVAANSHVPYSLIFWPKSYFNRRGFIHPLTFTHKIHQNKPQPSKTLAGSDSVIVIPWFVRASVFYLLINSAQNIKHVGICRYLGLSSSSH